MFDSYLQSSPKVVGLLFSASYCKWCHEFVPLLKTLHPHLQDIEIVLVGSDKTEEAYDQYKQSHPWQTIPFDDPLRARLRSMYGVVTIPALVFVKPDGSIVEPNGRHVVAGLMDDLAPPQVAHQLKLRFGIDNDIEIDYNSDNSDW
jgi:thiol-disulfide isomerase/thioredoxin